MLKTRAAELGPGPRAEQIARDLVDTMRASPACVGLAAPQIGEPASAFCVDVTGHRKARSCAGLIVMLNPVVVERGAGAIAREGCMSLPDFTGDVARATSIVVTGTTPDGREVSVEADAFEARALQHEIDHLDGILFLDRAGAPGAVFRRRRYAGGPS